MIKICKNGWFYPFFIGSDVIINNSVASSNIYQIIDMGHDDSGNTFDLISKSAITKQAFGSNQIYANSSIRTWLNNTYYNGFSDDIKEHMTTMTVRSNDTNLYDKVKLPSYTEYGYTTYNNIAQKVEGTKYNYMFYFNLAWHGSRSQYNGGGAVVLGIAGTSPSHSTPSTLNNQVSIFRLS